MSVLRAARAAANISRTRAFSSTATARKDLIQDLYVKELKGYKAPPQPKDAHVGVVKAYSLPPKPQPPSISSDYAAELNAYDASEPAVASESAQASSAAAGAEEGEAGGADAFLEFLEQDLPKREHHDHH